jgi:predicted ribosomally synthesized peptide with SipW-like signal peptide
VAKHRSAAAPPPRRPRVRIRAVLALGAVLGLGGIGTGAYWHDEAALTPGSIASGTLDLTLDDDLAGPGGTHTQSSLSLDDMLPGESVASVVHVQNAGTVDLRYTASATSRGRLADALTFEVYPSGDASNTGSEQAGDRTGFCSGSSTFGPGLLTDTGKPVIAAPRTLVRGASEAVCIVAGLPAAADDAVQNASATVDVVFDAMQVKAP